MNITELKSRAYDVLANIEYLQKQLQEINQEISKAIQDEQANTDSVSE
jgi:hypothetical protein